MTSSQRMILNTFATFARSLFSAGLALFSSRWILDALGQIDFGLFALVGSLIAFVAIINGVLGGSAGRFFAFSIGKRDYVEVNQWFNTAVVIHIFFPFILICIGWPIGEYFINNVLDIPFNRLAVSVIVFRLSLIDAFFAMLAVPYIAMFSAKQHIAETSFWGLLQSLLTFFFAFSLSYISGDRLLVYTIGMICITLFVTAFQVLRAKLIFPECRIKQEYLFSKQRIFELFKYASWSLIGCIGGLLRNQGTAILLNIFYGAKVNAAYGIANQVATQSGSLAQAMIGAMSPEITTVAGSNDHKRFQDLTFRASRYSTLLFLLIFIPLFIEMDYVLYIWLKSFPKHTTIFCQIILLSFLVDKLTIGHMIAINSSKKIAGYQSSVGIILLLTFPLAYILIKVFVTPNAALIASLVTSVCSVIGRVFWGYNLVALSPRRWIIDVFLRCLIVALPVTVLIYLLNVLLSPGMMRFVLSVLLNLISMFLFGWFFGLKKNEHTYIIQSLKNVYRKLFLYDNEFIN
jgi:O-antigen/teichoic acid export membrane protein